MNLQRFPFKYTRTNVEKYPNSIFIFTDNGNRTSGSYKIPDDSEYSKRFGKTDLKHPSTTSAIIRGMEKAFPVTTQKLYVAGLKRFDGNWTDDDFEEFKKVIDDDFEHIKEACKRYKPKIVYFPNKGILNGCISRITFNRTPKLYNYIIEKEIELKKFEP
jgi:hypothetical protein